MKKLDWMKEVDWKEGLTDDLRLVLSVCGEEAVLALLERIPGHRIYVSASPIRRAQREYVKKFTGKSPRELSLRLQVSESFVRKVLLENEDD